MSRDVEERSPSLHALSAGLKGRLSTLFDLALEAAARGDAPFGCVLADRESGDFLLSTANTTGEDPTGHAEINALRLLAELNRDPRTIALVSTAEPCPLCAGGIWWSGIETVVFGTTIDRLIGFGWRQLKIPAREVFDRGVPSRAIAVVEGFETSKSDVLYAAGPRFVETVSKP